jgi:NO-binding membrane sensor protein with MHYT domain
MLTVHNFSYGLLTPALAYLMSFLGAFLGLRCTSRARASTGATRIRWLLLAAVSIGITGIWVMHFIAMLGFTIPGETIRYNVPVTLLSMLIAVVFVLIGVLIVGLSQATTMRSLLLGGVLTGLGVAAMHYSGMAAMRMSARMSYNPQLFALSIVIAIVAATAALWATLRLSGFWSAFGAAAIMGVAVSGMHYTGMAAMRDYPPNSSSMAMGGADAAAFLLPLIVGVSITTFVLTATIALSPTAEEISAEAELMRKIDSMKAQPTIVSASAPAATNHNPNFKKLTLRQ